MPYIGRPLNAGNLAVQSGTGDGSDTTPIATLDYSVGSSNSIGVYLDGVRQLAGTDFTASGTVLTFTTAPANLVGIDVYFLGLELSIPTPADRTVTLAKMATGTDGNIISYDASGNPVAIATGSDGQVLTSAGAGAPPAFAALDFTATPSFSAYENAAVTNVTGGGAVVSPVSFNTELYDQATNFASDTFTAPTTGKYLLIAQVSHLQATINTCDQLQMFIITSNRTYKYNITNTNLLDIEGASNMSVIADMDADDTALCSFAIYGASNVADIQAGHFSFFMGHKLI